MDFYVDVTPVPRPSSFYASHSSHASGSPPQSEQPNIGATSFLVTGSPEFYSVAKELDATSKLPGRSLKIDSTPFISEGGDSSALRSSPHERSFVVKDFDVSKIAEDRIKLLALKYANDSVSVEVIARLAILNSRLIERSPRVTIEQISFLEGSIDSVKSIEQSRLDRAKRLGLSV